MDGAVKGSLVIHASCGGFGDVVAVVGDVVIRQNGSQISVFDSGGNFLRSQ